MANDAAQGAAAAEAQPGFFGILINVLLAPSEAFAAILKSPSVWGPLLLCVALHVGFTVVWMQNVDPVEFMKARIAESPQGMEQVPPERRAEMIEQQASFLPVMAWVGPVFVLLFILVLAAILTFVYRFFFAGEVSFKQGLAISAWVNAATGLVSTPLMLLVMFLKDDWTVAPQEALQANPTLFIDRDSVSKPLFSFLGSLDAFSFWTVSLLAIGFGLASRARFGSAIWGIGTVWIIYVIGKVGLSFFF
jgi:hypothetical protein